MATRIPSHQLTSGLYVSTRPENHKQPQTTLSSRAVPYTGGDVKKSGELGKMFDIPVVDPTSNGPPTILKPSRPSSSSGSLRSNSGQLNKSNSGPIKKPSSGPMPLPTGLLTSGPLSGSNGARRSVQLEPGKVVYGTAVTNVGEDVGIGVKVSKAAVAVVAGVFLMAVAVGVFMLLTVKNGVILFVVGGALVPVVVVVMWNCIWSRRGLLGYLSRFPDAELRGARDGQFVKVTGVVTCGSIPLETSYQRVPRCVYVSTELHEYKGCGGKSANSRHCPFSWGVRHIEKHVADFYISDFQSGLRALVKAGYGTKVAPFVKPTTVVDITKNNRDLSPSFLRWLADRNLSSDDRIMRLEEGYIKEGSTVSVMGIVQRQDSVLMINPSPQPTSTGCQWFRCLFPTYVEGLVLKCDESQNSDVIPV